jgi:uncharacterized membrane protein
MKVKFGMSRKTIYFHHSFLFFALLLLLLVTVVGLVFVGVIGVAFSNIGFTPVVILLILVGTLLGSAVNIPIWRVKTTIPMIREEYVTSFGMTYRIPRMEYGQTVTKIAVNVGGALIPTAVSIYLLANTSTSMILYSIEGIAVVALVTRIVARPIKGVGIVTPAFIPPIAAAAAALILSPAQPRTIAYVAGVLGTLIGADLLNLRAIPKLGAPVASIGGAGTFDGVFLSGILAVLLAGL